MDDPTKTDRRQDEYAADREKAYEEKGLAIVGFPRRCHCGGRAYHSPTSAWQNRVVCLSCGKKWSE